VSFITGGKILRISGGERGIDFLFVGGSTLIDWYGRVNFITKSRIIRFGGSGGEVDFLLMASGSTLIFN
jgi:hypothetical protein